jgi:hypothetical protein
MSIRGAFLLRKHLTQMEIGIDSFAAAPINNEI